MTFIEARFPTDISYGSSGGPEYSTEVIVTHSGYEQRNINWSEARARYNVAHGVKTRPQLDTLIAFFRTCKGMAHGFRFKDWGDYQASSQIIGQGDGVTTAFQLVKTYQNGTALESRVISKPVEGSVNVYIDNVLQPAWAYSVDISTGIVTFNMPAAASTVITADFEFDVPVRFDTDRLNATLDSYGSHSWYDIPIIEIKI